MLAIASESAVPRDRAGRCAAGEMEGFTQYRLTCHSFPAGEQLTILASDHGGGALCIERRAAEALLQRPLWNLTDLRALCGRDPALSVAALLTNGLMEPFVIHRVADWPACIVVVTADRPGACVRAVESLIPELHLASPRKYPFLVVDNSTTAVARDEVARRLHEIAERCKIGLVLFTSKARERLVAAVRSVDATAAEAAEFALLASRPGATNVGAVRNFINLITIGHRVISIDDDVTGPVAQSPSRGVSWASGGRCAAMSPLSRSDCASWNTCSLMAGHLDLLGSTLGDGHGPILLTVNGLRGDCGADAPWRELLDVPSQSSRPVLTRQVLRGVTQATVTPIDGLMTYVWGLFNDGQFPPFMPIGRNQDGAFAAMLRLFRPAALMCHLPIYVTHRPSERRSERRYRDVAAAVTRRWRTNDLVELLSCGVPDQPHAGTARARMSDVLRRVAGPVGRGDLAALVEVWVGLQRQRLSSAERWATRSGWRERRRLLRAIERCRTQQFVDAAVVPAEWAIGEVGALGRYLQAAADTIARWPDVGAILNRLPRWQRPWTQLDASDGVFHFGPA